MDQDTRNKLQRATQQVRRILEDEFAEQLEGTFDVLPDGKILSEPGKHLDARQRLTRQKLVEAIEHIKAGGKKPQDAVDEYTREAAFTFLNRFVALRMLEARGMLQECVSKGDASSGLKEFCGLAPGLSSLDDGGYRLYLECLFDELSVQVKVLFDGRDSAGLLWPRRGALTELLEILGLADLAGVWGEDETIGWVYQYFNSGEERKKMREESSAPRNSRELAVRNQFFTPRYVVEFLTDNTLGRIWYEMRKGETRLIDECQYLVRRQSEVFLNEGEKAPSDDDERDFSQEELLKKTVYIPHRPKKDPRDLKILDPACGSGHFLLYAFDLLISIYDEAWHDEASPLSEVTGRRLRDDYTDLKQLHAALPGLVLAHNLHGIDIDPRAAQIAALALWMRGQRAFNEFKITPENRLPIARSNIVCAEPMPGEATFLDEFIAEYLSNDAEGQFLASLVRKVFEAMKLAGEAGSLLKIEEDIAEEVAKAKKRWMGRPEFNQKTLFADEPKTVQKELDLTRGITEESFWEDAEEHIYDALRAYSEQAERSGGFQRRLFAVDTARGFAFIDLCRQRYDVVLMNPPFGSPTKDTKAYIESTYVTEKKDIAICFVANVLSHLASHGIVGALTTRTPYYLKMFAKWRSSLLGSKQPFLVFADLGYGILDAMVETVACVYGAGNHDAMFLKLTGEEERAKSLRELASSANSLRNIEGIFVCNPTDFTAIPGTPVVYWLPISVLSVFRRFEPFESDGRDICQGAGTTDDFRFLRLWWETPLENERSSNWLPFAKGGGYSPGYRDLPLVVKWNDSARELKQLTSDYRASKGWSPHWTAVLNSYDKYLLPGITFASRPHRRGYFSILPRGCVFSVSGMAVLAELNDVLPLLATLNSDAYLGLVDCLMPRGSESGQTMKYELGYLRSVPVPRSGISNDDWASLKIEAERIFNTMRQRRAGDETDRSFCSPWLLLAFTTECDNFDQILTSISELRVTSSKTIDTAIAAATNIAGKGYGFRPQDQSVVIGDVPQPSSILDDNVVAKTELTNIFSWAVGVSFGRWTNEVQSLDVLVDIAMFDEPVPASPAMRDARARQPKGVLVDDEGHSEDIRSQVAKVLREVWPLKLESLVDKFASEFRLRDRPLRTFGQSKFFDEHLTQYTESKRTAPIYWQLATPSASYSVWLYYHRFTRDTYFQVLNEYVKPKLAYERQKLERVRSKGGAEPTRSQRKEIEDQEKFVAELASMAEEIERIAPLWNPNLNDGVIINFAPLWRLVPQNKSWQKECKKCWDKLVAGDYDWAHLAMHLWPERVVPKCVTDASLAIAHGLENVFWKQDDRDCFEPKEEPAGGWEPIVKELLNERTSPAVKAALESLLTAPALAASSKSRRRKATK